MATAGESAADKARALRARGDALHRQALNYEKGANGERRTAEKLQWLPPGFTALHDLAVPGSRANIDHLVLGASGAYVLDTKEWNDADAVVVSGKTLLRRGRSLQGQFATLTHEAERLEPLLGMSVRRVLVFANDNLDRPMARIGETDVVNLSSLSSFLIGQPTVLTPGELDELRARALALPSRLDGTGRGDTRRSSSSTPGMPGPSASRENSRVPSRKQGVAVLLAGLIGMAVLLGIVLPRAMTRAASAIRVPATPPAATAGSASGPTPLVETPMPSGEFSCPVPGAGYTFVPNFPTSPADASGAVLDVDDPAGQHHSWVWGKSSEPPLVRGIPAGANLPLALRASTPRGMSAAGTATLTAPADAC